MKKWTINSSSCSSSVTLEEILSVRSGHLNETEIWALLGQSGHALQDLLLSINKDHQDNTRNNKYNKVNLTPDRLECSISGKVSILEKDNQPDSSSHDELLNEIELEALGIYSLGQTMSQCAEKSFEKKISEPLNRLLKGMTDRSGRRTTTKTSLFELLRIVSQEWSVRVGTSPISRIVAQLCKVTLIMRNRNSSSSSIQQQQQPKHSSCSSSVLLTNHDRKSNQILTRCVSSSQQVVLPPLQAISQSSLGDEFNLHPKNNKNELSAGAPLAEVEFSRLEEDSNSEDSEVCSNTNVSSSMPDLTCSTSPPRNHNNNYDDNQATTTKIVKPRGPYGRRLDYQPSMVRTLVHKTVMRKNDDNEEGGENQFYENFPFESKLEERATFTSKGISVQHQQEEQLSLPELQQQKKPTAGELLPTSSSSNKQIVHPNNNASTTNKQSSWHKTSSSVSNTSEQQQRVRKKPVQRNPSRLYRVVRPLTEITPSISPATKRCVGPEFVVMAAETDSAPVVVDLTSHLSSRSHISSSATTAGTTTAQVCVVMLNGQRILVHCSPYSLTAGELLDQVLSNQDIKESYYFALAVRREAEEYWILSSETKLHKVAPCGWKDPHRTQQTEEFTLYLRFKFMPDSVDDFKDPHNKHQLYLQLRRDVIEGRYHLPVHQHLCLAGMALQTEFGDFSEDIHGDGEYFLLEHYVPRHVLTEYSHQECRSNLTKLHRAYLGQSQSKTELRYCKEIQRLDNYGFQNFSVRETKKITSLPKRHLGIHFQGIFLFETSKDPTVQHKILASFYWQNITRIQYDKCRFQISCKEYGGENNEAGSSSTSSSSTEKSAKVKFYVSELKSKLMFDLSSAHHQFYVQQRLRDQQKMTENETHVEYREPRGEKTIRTLKNRLLSKRQLSQRKLYTKTSLRRAESLTSSDSRSTSAMTPYSTTKSMLVKRLTHYSSMADALARGQKKGGIVAPTAEEVLNCSDKENMTPNRHQSYRYKVYLEPDEDENPERQQQSTEGRAPLQEKPISSLVQHRATSPRPPAPPPRPHARRRISTTTTAGLNHRRRSDSVPRSGVASSVVTTGLSGAKKSGGRRSFGGGLVTGTPGGSGAAGMRMGTRISLSALHRERLRLATDLGTTAIICPPSSKKRTLDLDYGTMEFKSIIPPARPAKPNVKENTSQQQDQVAYDEEEGTLSDSLIERFDNMESEDSEPERQIVSVTLKKDNMGRLGLKITGTPAGIFIDEIDSTKVIVQGELKLGDRLVAINGRSLENVPYSGALDLIRKSSDSVQFLVSQIKT